MVRKIIVGSKNPAKVKAVKNAAISLFDGVEVDGMDAPSLISHMPLSSVEARIGAKNRANFVIKNSDAWIAVGNEGGVTNIDGVWYLFGTTYATDGKYHSWGGELMTRLPDVMVDGLKGGQIELGTVLDKMTGQTNTKQKGGAVALLTNNVISRGDVFQMNSIQALAFWLRTY